MEMILCGKTFCHFARSVVFVLGGSLLTPEKKRKQNKKEIAIKILHDFWHNMIKSINLFLGYS
jgi:hypothetical protein